MTVGKGGKAVAFGASGEGVFKNLQIILEARGRKNTDRSDQLKALNRLYIEQCPTVYAKIRVLLALISSYFDYAAANAGVVGSTGFGVSAYMPLDTWSQAREQLNELLDILIKNKDHYIVSEVVKEEYDDLIERSPNQNGEGDIIKIRGNVVSLVERLDDEFFKSLQNLDPHASEYVERLRDEKLVYDTLVRSIKLFEGYPEQGGKGPDGETALGRVLLRRLEHIYSKVSLLSSLNSFMHAQSWRWDDIDDHSLLSLYLARYRRRLSRTIPLRWTINLSLPRKSNSRNCWCTHSSSLHLPLQACRSTSADTRLALPHLSRRSTR